MKIVKQFTLQIVVGACLILSTTAQADNTGSRVVQRIQISGTNDGRVYFRPKDLGTWGGSGCPNANYASMDLDATGVTEVINLAMASKLNGSTVRFTGTCSADGNYLYINYAVLN